MPLSSREKMQQISDGVRAPYNIDPTGQQLPWELHAFAIQYDKGSVLNLYGQEVINYYWDLKGYRERAKKYGIEWSYNGDEGLKDNRWYNKNKDKVDK